MQKHLQGEEEEEEEEEENIIFCGESSTIRSIYIYIYMFSRHA
jgi:hypothetical protein